MLDTDWLSGYDHVLMYYPTVLVIDCEAYTVDKNSRFPVLIT